MTTRILSEVTASITELKINPMSILQSGEGEPVAILNRNKPAFYCVPADLYEAMIDMIEDAELAEIVRSREGGEEISVNIDDL